MGALTPIDPDAGYTTEHIVHVPVIKHHGNVYAKIDATTIAPITFDSASIRSFFEEKWFNNILLGEDSGLPLFLPSAYHFKLIIHHYNPKHSHLLCAKICRTIYTALVLNDDIGSPWATRMELGLKTIETRFKEFKYRGDLIICCGNKSMTRNKGLAVCVVNLYDAMPMTKEHEPLAMIEAVPGRVAHLTKDLRHFSRKFEYSKRRVSGSFQSTFQITLPDDVMIL